jgi:hypothetical protein
MTSPSKATFFGGPMDGSRYLPQPGKCFPTLLHMDWHGECHIYEARVMPSKYGASIRYEHRGIVMTGDVT